MKPGIVNICFSARRLHLAAGFAVAVVFAACAGSVAAAFSAPPEDLERGIAVTVDGEPAFIQASGAIPGETLTLEAQGPGGEITVTVAAPAPPPDSIIVLPVLIEDKSLARGVSLKLTTPLGNPAEIKIPPKRVFLSIPFTIPVTEEMHEDFGGPGRNLILQVVPKITKKAQVNIDNTSTDGLVTDVRYEGIGYIKLKDTLNRTNRRDMDSTYFIGKDPDYRWTLITENLFEKFDARNVGVMKNQPMGKDLKSQWRLDNAHDLHISRFGLNVAFNNKKYYAKMGNIDRVVKGKVHSELGYGDERLNFITRYEGMEVVNPSGRSPFAMKVDRFGYQARFAGGDETSWYEGRIGNLKVQDFNDEGEIDDWLNFNILYSTQFGGAGKKKKGRSWSSRKWHVSGETTMEFWGRGSATWLEGDMDLNIGYKNEYLAYFRYNDDFARVTGVPPDPLWESLFISFMRNRNYFSSKDPLAKYDLDSIFLDLDYSREKKGLAYARRVRFGLSRFMKVWKYDLPVELFIERGKSRSFRPGLTISIRRYL